MPLTREEADRAVEKLRIYSQAQRLMILSHLQMGELTVGEIDAATGIAQPALSQQLAELRRAGLVTTRRASKQVFYRLADVMVANCVRNIEAQFGGAGEPPSPLATAPASAPPSPASAPAHAIAAPRNRNAAVFARILLPGDA
ncbi:ArsR/SmtB family transcription factor [Ancylobacter radicis]|uniref:Helix-turn-helix transcriptional regulator n=1 Tax=Ancylobacter radicis TaxID=2836179 RepID=A0ABS5R1L8_9HYPH|nr:metalloregulator ArsR/SmtB family transcription factor [Ancylobacter radicis]MBS9475511.1 helix-turn-helix transcriptional regulator [Ancylobacter radicis]